VGGGLGFAWTGPTADWYGRRRVDSPVSSDGNWEGAFVHAMITGFDDDQEARAAAAAAAAHAAVEAALASAAERAG
jgi:hypothetical protein